MGKKFDDLPFNTRPDLSPFLIHLTRRDDVFEGTAYDSLVSILKDGEIRGSNPKSGFIKGPNPAACFMDVPFHAMKYVLSPENTGAQSTIRYEPYGIVIRKATAYNKGCRPVLYLSDADTEKLIPPDERWRVVRLEMTDGEWISWLHEREWRCKGSFILPKTPLAVLVKNANDAMRLSKDLRKSDNFRSRPQSIIPLSVVCQGYLKAH